MSVIHEQSRHLQDDFYIRKSHLDDIQTLNELITYDYRQQLNLFYNNPNILTLFQRSFVSFTILDQTQNIIGAACFDDFPIGLTGKYDDKHYNLWEDWLARSFNLEGLNLSSSNTLWLNFFCISDRYKQHIDRVFERLLQNLYTIQPQLDGVLFMRRGQVDIMQNYQKSYNIIRGHFIQLKAINRQVLKNLIGISYKSQLYYSPKYHAIQQMQIRMAKQEDHDDLAEIFNKQSEVLTSQFGEFFIADLIATQNLTRRMTKDSNSQGKAIVGQVGSKAIGLMSISSEIDYNLLNQCFQLNTFDNLIKNDLLEAINARYQQIKHEQKVAKQKQQKKIMRQIEQERVKILKYGQRIILQQFCIEKESQIKLELENIANNEAQLKSLDIPGFEGLLKKWIDGFNLYLPSEIFERYPEFAKDLESYIMKPQEFFIETLQLFGLPKNYMKKQGHWKDWAKKIIEQNIAAQLRRPKKHTKKVPLKKGKNDKKEQQNLKPPEYFDISPFNQAFSKFVSVGSEIRSIFREETRLKQKVIRMLFCDEDGQMINDKNIDLNNLGKLMIDSGINVTPQMNQNMCSVLQAFGGINYIERIVQVQEKTDEKKNLIKKQQQPKLIEVVEKLVSYDDFIKSIQKIAKFDIELGRLGYLKSLKLDSEIKQIEQKEQKQEAKITSANKRVFGFGRYDSFVTDIRLNQFPAVPFEAYNAIVINLFCIDELYQSRSLDFIQFAFSLFPDKDYIIITQPFTVPESSLVKNFIQVPRKKNSTFEHCLYIFHKDSLYAKQIKVRKSQLIDLDRGQYLLNNMINQEQIQKNITASITKSSSQLQTLSVYCSDELIGLYTISKNVNLDYYVSHFFIQDQIILDQHPRDKHTKVIYSFINPLFIKNIRFILKEIMRLTNKTCLYFEVHNRTLLPDIFNEFTPLRMRIFPHFLKKKWNFAYQKQDLQRNIHNKKGIDTDRNPFDQEQAPFSLSMITKKDLNTLKINNNTRIVIVGASDTGISFIESLLMLKQINFTNITLLSPGGIVTMHIKNQADLLKASSTSYTLEQLKNLMIDARTTVLDAKMVKLDKKQKRILIDKNAYLPYDILVLSVGLIDSLLQNQGLVSCGLMNSPYYKDKSFINGVYSIDDPYLYQNFSKESKNISLLKRKKKPQNITIYGRTPHTIAFISGLLQRGVAPERIYYVVPGSSRRRTQKFQSNQQRIQYESQIINDPDTFQDINVQKIVIDHLRHIGVNVQLGFEFYQFDGNALKGIKFRKKADNYEQLQEMIKKKRQQIELKLQQMGNKMGEEFYEEDSEQLEQKISPERQIELLQQQQWKQLYTPSAFFITSGLIDIDREIFNIIHENGLVYNGRLIVKSNFQTTEKEVFACGRICEFSQRYKNFSVGKSLRLDRYNGRELGSTLAKHILELMNLSYLTTQTYTQDQLPRFYMPVGMGSSLPGGMVYYFIKRTDTSLPKVVYEKGITSSELISKNIKDFKGHYIKFGIDPNGMIESVSYLGSEQVVVPSLNSFIGLNIQYLNKISKRNDAGLIPDIAEFLSENWAITLYHELFSEFRHYIKKSISSKPVAERLNNRASERSSQGNFVTESFLQEIRALVPVELRDQIREGTVSFIEQNKNHLPMYYTVRRK